MAKFFFIKAPETFFVREDDGRALCSHFKVPVAFDSPVPQLAPSLLRWLDEPRTRNELLRRVEKSHRDACDTLLLELLQLNLIHQYQPSVTSEAKGLVGYLKPFWGAGAPAAARQLKDARIVILGEASLSSSLKILFQKAGLSVRCSPILNVKARLQKLIEATDFFIVIATSVSVSELHLMNQEFLMNKKNWLLVQPDPYGGRLGPAFGYDGGPCFDCLQFRLHGTASPMKGVPSPLLQSAFEDAMRIETIKLLAGHQTAQTRDGFWDIDVFNHRSAFHLVVPNYACVSCQSPVLKEDNAIR